MSSDLKEIIDTIVGKRRSQFITGTVTETKGEQVLVLLDDGRERFCWGNFSIGTAVIIQGNEIIARGRQGEVKTYQV